MKCEYEIRIALKETQEYIKTLKSEAEIAHAEGAMTALEWVLKDLKCVADSDKDAIADE